MRFFRIFKSFRSSLLMILFSPFILLILAVLYFEIITYSLLPSQWVKQATCDSPKCTKILFVADPQIIRSHVPGLNVINYLAEWDSDRYISKTFLQAFHYVKPEIIIFLGDFMDEGHIYLDEEFLLCKKRLLNIFHFSSIMNNVQKILLPGDNDIGGIDDIMIPHTVQRFNKAFNQSQPPLSRGNIEFYKINIMTNEIQEPIYADLTHNNNRNVRVAVSHVPLLANPTQFLQRVVKAIRPHLIFSGHAHESMHFLSTESNLWRRNHTDISPSDTEMKMYKLRSGMIHEIIVPTCSYRMGVSYMGYGAAFIDTQENVLYYGVLRLPRRFVHLFVYFVIFFITLALYILFYFALIIHRAYIVCLSGFCCIYE